jgi:hypothetical protein
MVGSTKIGSHPPCFQEGLFGGNFDQKHPLSFRGKSISTDLLKLSLDFMSKTPFDTSKKNLLTT